MLNIFKYLWIPIVVICEVWSISFMIYHYQIKKDKTYIYEGSVPFVWTFFHMVLGAITMFASFASMLNNWMLNKPLTWFSWLWIVVIVGAVSIFILTGAGIQIYYKVKKKKPKKDSKMETLLDIWRSTVAVVILLIAIASFVSFIC